MTWSNGDVYVGEFFNGVRHGPNGSLHFALGGEYIGDWECNQMHGLGTRRFPNGDVYLGPYADGQRCGTNGRFYFANGDLYMGSWSNDHMNGFGRYYYSSGQRYEGTFRDGRRHGLGKFQKTDGSLDFHWYEDDHRQGCGVRWSPLRNRAWKCDSKGRVLKKLSVEEALTLVYQLENHAAEPPSRVVI